MTKETIHSTKSGYDVFVNRSSAWHQEIIQSIYVRNCHSKNLQSMLKSDVLSKDNWNAVCDAFKRIILKLYDWITQKIEKLKLFKPCISSKVVPYMTYENTIY